MSHANDLAAFLSKHRKAIAKLSDRIYFGSNQEIDVELVTTSVYLCGKGLMMSVGGASRTKEVSCTAAQAVTAFTEWAGRDASAIVPWLESSLNQHGVRL